MKKESGIQLFDLIVCLSDTMDMMDPALVNHHRQVAYIAYKIAEELGLSLKKRKEILMAGALHDIGAISLEEKMEALKFYFQPALEGSHEHGEVGYLLLKSFKPFAQAARYIRFHHTFWNGGAGRYKGRHPVPLESHILHLADRIAVMIDKNTDILGQIDGICKRISEQSGNMFMPELVEAFLKVSRKESFWLDTVSHSILYLLKRGIKTEMIELDLDALLELTQVFSKIIDFRSPFTATHSSGVAASAEKLAELYGFSEIECRMMRIAGHLHDLGKLSIPIEILQKTSKLSDKEYFLIKSHTYYTYRTLEPIEDLYVINLWASLHHERLDGSGYPFHLTAENIPLGSRIMAVADIFTALTEDRPYRKGLSEEDVLKVLKQMVKDNAIDGNVVWLLEKHFAEVNLARLEAQEASREEYRMMPT